LRIKRPTKCIGSDELLSVTGVDMANYDNFQNIFLFLENVGRGFFLLLEHFATFLEAS